MQVSQLNNVVKTLITFSILLSLTVAPFVGSLTPLTIATAQSVPLHDVPLRTQVFNPTPVGDYEYYVIDPMTSFSQVSYENLLGGATSYAYSRVSGQQLSESVDSVNPGTLPGFDPWLVDSITNNVRDNPHPMFSDDYLPRAIRMDSQYEQHFEQSLLEPMSLHMDRSMTFFAESGKDYHAMVNSSSPFLLDVSLSTQGASITLDMTNTSYTYTSLSCVSPHGIFTVKRTIPVYPLNEDGFTGVVPIKIRVSQDTLVTLTPHPFDPLPTPINVPVNSTYPFDVIQGTIVEQTGKEYDYLVPHDENNVFSVTHFQFDLAAGKFYKISYPYARNLLEENGINDNEIEWMNCMDVDWFFLMEGYDENWTVVTSTFSSVTVYAKNNVTLTLVSSIHGFFWYGYDIIFQEIDPETLNLDANVKPSEALPLNQPIDNLYKNVYYNFTFDTPMMVAINRTGGNPNKLNFKLYRWNDEMTLYQGEWEYIADVSPTSSFLSIVSGNVFGGGLIATADWWYLPAGTYALYPKDFSGIIQVNAIPVTAPFSSSPSSRLTRAAFLNETFNLTSDDVVAIELPKGVINDVYWVNISSTDVNQSVTHEYVFLHKYGESLIIDNSFAASGIVEIGDETYGNDNSTTGVSNRTQIMQYVPVTENTELYLLIHPYQATNRTDSANSNTFTNFTTSLTVHFGPVNKSLYPTIDEDFGGQTFDGDLIPHDSISAPTTVNYFVNDDLPVDRNQVHAIPISVTPNSLYNVTIYAIGNDTTTFNVTLNSITVTGGNLTDLMVFSNFVINNNATHQFSTSLILTVTDTAYLYIDLRRNGNRNATLVIDIQELSVAKMTFNLEDLLLLWDETVLPEELVQPETLVTRIVPQVGGEPQTSPPESTTPEGGGFDPVTAGLTAVGILAILSAILGVIVFIRRRRS